jgi:hypothetical protein
VRWRFLASYPLAVVWGSSRLSTWVQQQFTEKRLRLVILIYKFCVFPTTAFENHFPAAFHEYFGGGFLIEEFHSYRELFQLYGNPDMRRGMQQLNFTAPVYAAIGYSIGTWLGMYYRVFPAFFKKRRGL